MTDSGATNTDLLSQVASDRFLGIQVQFLEHIPWNPNTVGGRYTTSNIVATGCMSQLLVYARHVF